MNYNWIWLAQIQGSSLIELRPKHPCEKTCSILKSIKLNNGDLSKTLFFTFTNYSVLFFLIVIYSRLYDAHYSPLNKETILLAQGVD